MAAPSQPGSGTATPLVELDPEETKKSLNVSLADLCAKATALYAHKKYEEAAEVYGQAAEMQAEMNGEMNPENAEILFLYGRALFKVGQSKSDVLGGKAPEAKPAKPKASGSGKPTNGSTSAAASSSAASGQPEIKKPLFQFEGDENFEDSDEEEEEGEEEEEEEEDDLATAFEVLDLARVLYEKKLEAAKAHGVEEEEEKGKGKESTESGSQSGGESAYIRHIKERLADTHDLLAEISLENERYTNAITDSRASLKYKEELYPFESEIIAEAHFKLSLALEFASVTKSPDDEDSANNNNNNNNSNHVDQALRDEAAAELEAAINSTKLKLQNKEVELATLHNPDDNEATRRQIAEVKEVLADMEQRLVDLRKPPVDLTAALGIPAAPKTEVTEEVKKQANDLTGLVRKKRKAEEGPAAEAAEPGKKPREGEAS